MIRIFFIFTKELDFKSFSFVLELPCPHDSSIYILWLYNKDQEFLLNGLELKLIHVVLVVDINVQN